MVKIPTLIILIGIPGSGKTRWAVKRSEYYRVCPDEIRKNLFNNISDNMNNDFVFSIAKGMIIATLDLKVDTIFDATNVNTFHRRKFFEGLPSHKKMAKIFHVEIEEAYKRITNDIKEGKSRSNVPLHSIYRCYGDFLYTIKEAINLESFDDIEYIEQDSF